MNKKFLSILLMLLLSCTASIQAWDLNDLGNLLGGNKDGNGSSSVADIIGGLFKKDKLSVTDLEGTWKYESPAVSFKSDNLLKKAGGEAAAVAVENKLAPYYKTTGLTNLVVTINSDSTFTFQVKAIKLTGTLHAVTESGADHNFIFQFKALGKINMGSMNAYITKQPTGKVDMMFDVSKLVALAGKVSAITKSNTISSAVKILESYDGICAGFKLSKQANATKK